MSTNGKTLKFRAAKLKGFTVIIYFSGTFTEKEIIYFSGTFTEKDEAGQLLKIFFTFDE